MSRHKKNIRLNIIEVIKAKTKERQRKPKGGIRSTNGNQKNAHKRVY